MSLEELLNLLKKFNQNWFDYPISIYDKKQEFGDMPEIPFFNKTKINNLSNEIKFLFHQRVFQRLNYIKQLSFIYLFYLGGCHSRLEHTLGTLCIGKKFLNQILKRNSVNINDYEKLGLSVALFIHDSCHGPFGHSLELIKNFLIPYDFSNEKIDKILIKKYLKDPNNTIKQSIDQISPIDPDKFSNFIISLFNNDYNDKIFLIEILNSLVDADRMDYIPRDRYHIGLTSNINPERLIDLFSTIKIIDKWGIYKNKIIFSSKFDFIIDNIIEERADMYNLYYHGEKCKIADTMLPHVIYQFLDYFGLILNVGIIKEKQVKLDILSEILKLSDPDFIRFLNLSEHPWYAIDLLDNLLNGQIYINCKEWNIFDNIEVNRNELKEISELVNQKAEQKGFETFEKDIKINLQLHKEVFDEYENILFETYLFHFITNCIKEIKGKIFTVESDFWENYIIKNDKIRKKVIQIGVKKANGDDKGKNFIDVPQVFMALPTYFPSFEEIIKYNHHPKEEEKSVPTLLYDPNKPIVEENIVKYLEKRASPRQVKSYSMYLLIPEYLKEFQDFILEEFEKYIKSLKWWIL